MKKSKLLISVAVSVLILSLIITAIAFILAPQGGDENIAEILQNERYEAGFNIANVIASASIEPLYDEDDFVMNEMIKGAVENSNGLIDYVYILDNDKKVWGDSKNPTNVLRIFDHPKIKPLTSENRKLQEIDDEIFDAGVPILSGTRKIGEVHVGMKKIEGVKGTSPASMLPYMMMLGVGILGVVLITLFLSKILGNLGSEFATSLRSVKIEELRKKEDEIQKDVLVKNNQIKEIEQKIEEYNKKAKESRSKFDEIQKLIYENEEKVDEKLKQVEYYESKINELEEKHKNLKNQIDEATSSEEMNTLNAQVNNFKLQLQQIMSDIEAKRNEEKALTEKIKQLQTQVNQAPSAAQPSVSSSELENRKREELEITQKIVAKRKEEIALSQRIELKRKKELELTGKLEILEKKLKEIGNG